MKRNKHYCIVHDLSPIKQPENKCIRTKTILVLLQESRKFILVKYRYKEQPIINLILRSFIRRKERNIHCYVNICYNKIMQNQILYSTYQH